MYVWESRHPNTQHSSSLYIITSGQTVKLTAKSLLVGLFCFSSEQLHLSILIDDSSIVSFFHLLTKVIARTSRNYNLNYLQAISRKKYPSKQLKRLLQSLLALGQGHFTSCLFIQIFNLFQKATIQQFLSMRNVCKEKYHSSLLILLIKNIKHMRIYLYTYYQLSVLQSIFRFRPNKEMILSLIVIDTIAEELQNLVWLFQQDKGFIHILLSNEGPPL